MFCHFQFCFSLQKFILLPFFTIFLLHFLKPKMYIKLKCKFFLPVPNYTPVRLDMGSGGINPHILNPGTRWRQVVSSVPCVIIRGYFPAPIGVRTSGPQILSGHFGEEKFFRPCRKKKQRFFGHQFRTVHTMLGVRGGVVFKALRYKPAGRGFDSRFCHWNFSVT